MGRPVNAVVSFNAVISKCQIPFHWATVIVTAGVFTKSISGFFKVLIFSSTYPALNTAFAYLVETGLSYKFHYKQPLMVIEDRIVAAASRVSTPLMANNIVSIGLHQVYC